MEAKPDTKYSKEALTYFHKLNYMTSLNGHCEFASSNTLKNSVKMAINFDGQMKRMIPVIKGGHYSETTYETSSFKQNVSK